MARRPKVGILDHASSAIGGAQFVNVCMAEALSPQAEVELIHGGSGYTLPDLARGFAIDLSQVRERILPWLVDVPSFGIPGSQSALHQLRSCYKLTKPYDVFIYSGLNIPPFCFAKAGFAYIHFPMDAGPVAQATISGRNALMHRLRLLAYGAAWHAQVATYDQWLANSSYTAGWIRHRWSETAPVVYPPVEADYPSVAKSNLVVSIGRISAGKRSKHQLEQVLAFREFYRKVDASWRLCLIGFCSKSSEDRRYLAMIEEAASGLPVTLLLDTDRRTSLRQIAEAKMFWHTTGLEIDESVHPELAEHFGIATVEAMRAGCVPVVIASGGQREIVQHGISGFLVHNLREVADVSIQLAADPALWTTMSGAAVERSRMFTKEVFQRQISALVSRLLH